MVAHCTYETDSTCRAFYESIDRGDGAISAKRFADVS